MLTHGAHYHRKKCKFHIPWIDPKTKKEILEDEDKNCPECVVILNLKVLFN